MDEIDVYKSPELEVEDVIIFKYPEFVDMDDEAKYDFWQDLNDHDKYIINQITTIANGFGRFNLYINEASRGPCQIKDYKELLTWDIDCWNLQQQWRLKDEYQPYDIGEYSFDKGMTGEWIRFIEDGRLVYGTLYSVASYIWWKMEEMINNIEEEIIPHEFVWNESKACDCGHEECTQVKITVNAKGREKEYDVLRNLTYKFIYTNGPLDIIISDMIKDLKGTFRIDKFDDPNDPYSDFIVCDQETLSKITPENFITDFKNHLNDNTILDNLIKDASEKVGSEYREYVKANM